MCVRVCVCACECVCACVCVCVGVGVGVGGCGCHRSLDLHMPHPLHIYGLYPLHVIGDSQVEAFCGDNSPEASLNLGAFKVARKHS